MSNQNSYPDKQICVKDTSALSLVPANQLAIARRRKINVLDEETFIEVYPILKSC